LDSKKTILVFSHIHNSFDKKELLKGGPNPNVHETTVKPEDLVKEPEILKFFLEDIDVALSNYEPGNVENKPDVTNQIKRMKVEREAMMQEQIKKQQEYQEIMNRFQIPSNPQDMANKIIELTNTVNSLVEENKKIQEKSSYYEDKLRQLISEKVQQRVNEKNESEQKNKNEKNVNVESRVELSNTTPKSISIV
jgi:hypothetical protein